MLRILTTCLALLVLTSSGCQTPDPTVDLLESELRWMEDNLYQLDSKLDRCCERLQSTQRYNETLKAELAVARAEPNAAKRPPRSTSASKRSTNSAGDTDRAGDADPQATDKDDEGYDLESDEELFQLDSPRIETGAADGAKKPAANSPGRGDSEPTPTESLPEGKIQIEGVPDPRRPELQAPPSGVAPDDPFDDEDLSVDLKDVTQLRLHPTLTGGYNFDGEPGHDGVMVVLEPRNEQDHFLPVAGDVTIELRDPNKTGLVGRIGKWNYDAAEASSYLKKSLLGRGFHFQLPWPGHPPTCERLDLTVEYAMPDGRSLRAERSLMIIPPSSESPSAHLIVSEAGQQANPPAWAPERELRTAELPPPLWQPLR